MNKKNLLLSILMLVFIQNSMFGLHADRYGVAGLEFATALARAGAVISDSGFVKSDDAKVETSGKLSKKSIVEMARIVNDIASFYSYNEIKDANDGFCGHLDLYNNFRYVALLWSLQDIYSLYSEIKASKVVKAEKTESAVSEKDKKKAEFIKLLRSKVLPAAESIAAVARSVESLRVTSRSCLNSGRCGIVGSCNLDYWCTFVITASRVLDEMLAYEKFSTREALIVSQALIFAGVVILDLMGYKPSLRNAMSKLFANKNVGSAPKPVVAPAWEYNCNVFVAERGKTGLYDTKQKQITNLTQFYQIVPHARLYNIYIVRDAGATYEKVEWDDRVADKIQILSNGSEIELAYSSKSYY